MVVSPRIRYIVHATAATLACLGSFLIAMGAAFGGGPIARQWGALGLLAASLLVLAMLSAGRAGQVGLPRWLGFVGVIAGVVMGPALLVVLLGLAFKADVPPFDRATAAPSSAVGLGLRALALLLWPIAVWWLFMQTGNYQR